MRTLYRPPRDLRVLAALRAIRDRAARVLPALAMRAAALLLRPDLRIPRYALCRLRYTKPFRPPALLTMTTISPFSAHDARKRRP